MSKYSIIYLQENTMCKENKMKKNNINFIFGLLDRKKVSLCLFIEAFLDFIYYVIPYTFALFLTMPFTIEKDSIPV